MGKLDNNQLTEYFDIHLPYRTKILLAHKNLVLKGAYYGEVGILNACFEASLITGRMYLNILGLNKNKQSRLTRYISRNLDDVSVEDLGGVFIDPESLSQEDKDDFVNFITIADKTAAHLTTPSEYDIDRTHIVIDKIIRLIKTNLYDFTNRPFKI